MEFIFGEVQISNGENDINFLFKIFLLDWFHKQKIIGSGIKMCNHFFIRRLESIKKAYLIWKGWQLMFRYQMTLILRHLSFSHHFGISGYPCTLPPIMTANLDLWTLLHRNASKARSDTMLPSPDSIWWPPIMLQAIHLIHDLQHIPQLSSSTMISHHAPQMRFGKMDLQFDSLSVFNDYAFIYVSPTSTLCKITNQKLQECFHRILIYHNRKVMLPLCSSSDMTFRHPPQT